MKFHRWCFEEIKSSWKAAWKAQESLPPPGGRDFLSVYTGEMLMGWGLIISHHCKGFGVFRSVLQFHKIPAFPSHTSPCLHQINSFRLLHTLDSKAKMKDLLYCLLPFVVSCAVGESDLSTPTLKTWRLKQVMWLGLSNKVSPVPCPSQVLLRSFCRRMEVQLLLMSETESEHIQNCSEVLCEWSPQCHH